MATITLTKTDAGRNLFRDAAKGSGTIIIKYFAVGTGSSTPSSGQTMLDAEAFRKTVTSYTNGATGELIINVYIAPSEAVGVNIAEVAVFAGTNATATANTGVMLGRGSYSKPGKLNTESIVLQLSLQF
jgi:hypothetical protein